MNNEFKKLTPFKMQVLQNFPFIDEDFDAITNYELLCKVVEYLNKTIDKVNEFQHYFDNLDVQEEINNKLDEMAESGELQEIINSYLAIKSLIVFDNVSLMKESTNLVNGSYAKTLGYYDYNTGGGSLYKIEEYTNQVVNEMDVIKINDNLVAVLITSDYINVKQLGAKGDNTNNDRAIIQYALDNYINVYIPEGVYLVTDSLQIRNYNKVYGLNSKKSIITTNNEISIFKKSGDNSYYNIFENIGIDGNNRAVKGIDLTNIRESYLSNLYIINCQSGLYLDNSWSNTIRECDLKYNSIQNIFLGDASNDINIIDSKLDLAGKYGININGSSYSNMINIDGCVLQQNGICAINLVSARLINISNCYFENNNTTENESGFDIYINSSTTSVINLLNNSFYLNNVIGSIYIEKAKEIMINNMFVGRNDLTKQFNSIKLSDSVSVQHIYLFGYAVSDTTNITILDNDNNITDFSSNTIVFKNGINISKSYPVLQINSKSTGNPEFIMSADGDRISRLYANRSTKVAYFEKINTTNNTMENIIQFSAGNVIQPQKDINSNYRIYGRIQTQFGATGNRPSSPYTGEVFMDTTLQKPIFYTGSKWVDGSGTQV